MSVIDNRSNHLRMSMRSTGNVQNEDALLQQASLQEIQKQ